jgi:hypothetical protein
MKKELLENLLAIEEEIGELYSEFSNYQHFPDNDALVSKALCASNLRMRLGELCLELDKEIRRRQGYKVQE